MIKRNKIAFLQILTVFGTDSFCTLLDGAMKQKTSDKKANYTKNEVFY